METFPSMAAACEHFARLGFTDRQTGSDGRVMLLHPSERARVHLVYSARGRVRSLRVFGRTGRGDALGAPRRALPEPGRGTTPRPLGLLALPFIAAFAAYGLVLALVLISWDHRRGIPRSS